MASVKFDPKAVFLNVPFDAGYQKQFVALVAAIISIGRVPRCVLEVAEGGAGRLDRILTHMSACAVSIHDLSRVGIPARFNMPFELGLACALAHLQPPHSFVLLERERFRLQRTLSDLNGRDPYIHSGSSIGTINCVLDALRPSSGAPDSRDVVRLYRRLRIVAQNLAGGGRSSIFNRSGFLDLVEAGLELATRAEMISK